MSTSIDSVKSILERNQFTEDIDGVPFKLRKITAEMAIHVLGTRSLGIVRGAASKAPVSAEDSLFLVSDMMPKFLEMGMIEPGFGQVTDPEAGVISLDDLGDFGPKVFASLLKKSGYGNLVNFQKSSEGTKEES